jgi:hypothetical protein
VGGSAPALRRLSRDHSLPASRPCSNASTPSSDVLGVSGDERSCTEVGVSMARPLRPDLRRLGLVARVACSPSKRLESETSLAFRVLGSSNDKPSPANAGVLSRSEAATAEVKAQMNISISSCRRGCAERPDRRGALSASLRSAHANA